MSKRQGLPLLAFIVLIVIWEVGSRFFLDMSLVLPPPSKIVLRVWEGWDRFFYHSKITLKTMLGGCFLACLVAFPLAWMMALWNSARLILQPIFILIQCIPMFALAPIMIIWFGWTYTAIVVPTALMIFFPLTMNIYHGIRSTPNSLIEYFKINQATRWQVFYKLQLPWALPHILAGFRIATAIAGIGAIAGEWAGAQSGLGLLMLESRRGADLEATFGALLCLTFISLGLYGMTVALEKKVSSTGVLSRQVFHLILGLTLVGCQETQTNQTRLILDWLPNPNHVPIYVGIQQGYFTKQGIDLCIYKSNDVTSSWQYLSSRQVELAISYMPTVVCANLKGARLQAVGVLIPEPLNALIYRTGLGITSPSDLNDKVIGYCVEGSERLFLDHFLKERQITPKKVLNVSFDLVSSMGTKQVDAIYGAYWNIECAQLHSLGIETNHFKLSEFGMPPYCELIILAKEESLQTTTEFISHFQSALQESIDFCKAYPNRAFEIYLQANPDKGEKTRLWEKESWLQTYPLFTNQQTIDPNIWQNFAHWLSNH